ncbi:hypothetical protein O3G_MSEX008767, partial [Manduca sexta]
MIRILTSLYY